MAKALSYSYTSMLFVLWIYSLSYISVFQYDICSQNGQNLAIKTEDSLLPQYFLGQSAGALFLNFSSS